jgi:predicted permease
MQPILAITVPFFALVLCGWLAARVGVLPDSAIPGLNAFVLYFAMPCMLLLFGMATPLFELLNPALLGERYGADNGRIARIILSSTVLAFVSFTLLAWGFGAAAGV